MDSGNFIRSFTYFFRIFNPLTWSRPAARQTTSSGYLHIMDISTMGELQTVLSPSLFRRKLHNGVADLFLGWQIFQSSRSTCIK